MLQAAPSLYRAPPSYTGSPSPCPSRHMQALSWGCGWRCPGKGSQGQQAGTRRYLGAGALGHLGRDGVDLADHADAPGLPAAQLHQQHPEVGAAQVQRQEVAALCKGHGSAQSGGFVPSPSPQPPGAAPRAPGQGPEPQHPPPAPHRSHRVWRGRRWAACGWRPGRASRAAAPAPSHAAAGPGPAAGRRARGAAVSGAGRPRDVGTVGARPLRLP